MPNIAITNQCNLKCEYCFAEEYKQQNKYEINLTDYQQLLYFSSTSNIGIIGGEPTLHPDFVNILKCTNYICNEQDIRATLFTNGIELKPFLSLIEDKISILININSPSIMTDNQISKLSEVLDSIYTSPLANRTTCGCNIHLNCTDYDYIWKIVEKYSLFSIRCSVVSPGGCYLSMRDNKDDYYKKIKPIFLNFCQEAQRHCCRLNMDCNKIPICYFTEEEMQLVLNVCHNYDVLYCNPVIDFINANEAVSCFGNINQKINIDNFDSLDELKRYFQLNNYDRIKETRIKTDCNNCMAFKLKKCQGGCMAFNH